MSSIVDSKKESYSLTELPFIDESDQFIKPIEESDKIKKNDEKIEEQIEESKEELIEKPIEEKIEEPIKEKTEKVEKKKKTETNWPDINITNVTQDILLYEQDNDWENCNDYYRFEFYKAMLNLYKTGDIVDFSKGFYQFNVENYIDTTTFERASYTINGEQINTLIAGDIITFETDHFDFGIFVTEVQYNSNILSKINTSIYDKPETSYILTNDFAFSTVKDTLGNCYVIKKRVDNNQMEKQISTFLNLSKQIQPSNLSVYDPTAINNDNSPYSSSYYYDTIFNENRLIYKNNSFDYKTIEGTNDVIIPSQDEVAKKSETNTIKPFNCNIKGFFSVHRSKSINNEPILQCMNFEIYFINHINSNSDSNIIIDNNFLQCRKDTNDGKYYVYLVDDSTHSSCFFSGGGFYNSNQYNSDNSQNKFELRGGINGFHIYSPYFFTDQPKPVTKQIKNYQKKNERIYIDDYKNDRLDMLRSIKTSNQNNPNDNKGCTIV